jgi:hypothetical protein
MGPISYPAGPPMGGAGNVPGGTGGPGGSGGPGSMPNMITMNPAAAATVMNAGGPARMGPGPMGGIGVPQPPSGMHHALQNGAGHQVHPQVSPMV